MNMFSQISLQSFRGLGVPYVLASVYATFSGYWIGFCVRNRSNCKYRAHAMQGVMRETPYVSREAGLGVPYVHVSVHASVWGYL